MSEAITAVTSGAKSVEPRRLHPGLAFLGGPLGLGVGYLYVGRARDAFVFVFALYLFLFMAGWTRMAIEPAGWYALIGIIGLMWLVQFVHPMVIAWGRPIAPHKRYNRWWWYIAWIVGLNVASLPVAANRGAVFGYDHYFIPSRAMSPTMQPGDRIVVDTRRYRDTAPTFGDIVICDFGDGTLVVKRVVGVPGDTIELRGPLLVRNGRAVDEPYLSSEQLMRLPDSAPLTLGADEFFVLGDNRGNSFDSRQQGPLGRDQISGRVEFIYYSRSRTVNWERFPVMLAAD